MYRYFLKNALWYNKEINALENDNNYLKELLKEPDKTIGNSTMHRIAKERLLLNKSRKQNFNNEVKDNLDKLKDLNDEELSKLCWDELICIDKEIFMLIKNNNIKNIKKFILKEYELFIQELNSVEYDYHYCKTELRKLKQKRQYLRSKLYLPNKKINNTTTNTVYKQLLIVNDLKIENIEKEMNKYE